MAGKLTSQAIADAIHQRYDASFQIFQSFKISALKIQNESSQIDLSQ